MSAIAARTPFHMLSALGVGLLRSGAQEQVSADGSQAAERLADGRPHAQPLSRPFHRALSHHGIEAMAD
jgi:hypothetical protein